MPAITGILETALYVKNLERAIAFYETVLGFERMVGDERFQGMSVSPGHVLVLFREGASTQPSEAPSSGIIPPHDGHGTLHLAFAIRTDTLDGWRARLAEHGVAIESEVHPPRGGTSLYFRDPDNHLVELATPGIWPNY